MKFVIQSMGQDNEHLPASHTCFNILDLPVPLLSSFRLTITIIITHPPI
jgi:hypothetical protein